VLWQGLLAEARERDGRGRRRLPRLVGYDNDPAVVRAALDNVERAGLRGLVHVERRDLTGAAPVGERPGVLVTNPPYGERLGERRALEVLYRRLGDVAKQRFPGWTAWILTGNPDLSKYIGLRITRRQVLFNGAIECRLLTIPVHAGPVHAGRAAAAPSDDAAPDGADERGEGGEGGADAGAEGAAAVAPSERPAAPVAAFANRLRKNLARLERWAKREGVTCYRVYDADLPEYALEIDRYEQRVHVQERERPKSVDPVRAVVRLNDALLALQDVLGVRPEDVFVKHRSRHRGSPEGRSHRSQYEKVAKTGDLLEVREGGHRFLVNLRDYFDTGLFLDHRPTRALLGELAAGRDFLNLFAYTGTATVYAAKGGAASTTSVDLSNTYLEWAARNLERNGLRVGDRHRLERADCLRWLEHDRRRYGLVFLDPPTWSTSKGMQDTLDVQRDHVRLLRATARLLTDDGILVFSTNFRRFRLDAGGLPELVVEDITRRTVPPDFARDARVHHTFRITRRPGSGT
jgi:23S rRNA (guanine2445-N2)-methyltransferase / 23S rRNA (guanine2069-N7)-methyltransferase